MNASTRSTGRTVWVAVRTMALFTVLLGVIYGLPIAMTKSPTCRASESPNSI
mgnify:CR=1 FL=1